MLQNGVYQFSLFSKWCKMFRMKSFGLIRIVSVFLFLFAAVDAEELFRGDLPLSEEEIRLLQDEGYRIAGDKTFCADYQNESLYLSGNIPLFNRHGERCYACQKLVLPLEKLRFPLICKEEGEQAMVYYGPYSFSIAKMNSKIWSRLKEAAEREPQLEMPITHPTHIAKQQGCVYLAHSTRPENLIEILKSGELNPSRGKTGRLRGDLSGNDRFVFCSLVIGKPERDVLLPLTGNGLPILVFNTDPSLDRYPWHASAGHPRGAFLEIKTTDKKLYYSAHYSDSERFAKLLSQPQTKKRNEIVFHHPLPLDGLEMIVVKRGMKQALIDQLPDNKYQAMIVEVDPLHESSFNFPAWLKPYSGNSHDKIRFGLKNPEMDLLEFKSLVRNEYPQLIECEALEADSKELWFRQLIDSLLRS